MGIAALHPSYDSFFGPRDGLLRFARNDGAWHRAYTCVLATRCVRVLHNVVPQTEGAGNAGCLLHPRSRVQCVEECAHEHTGTAGALRHSLRNGLTAYAALSLETNSSCLHRCRLDGSSIRLDQFTTGSLAPATGVGTTRFCRTRQRRTSCTPDFAHRINLPCDSICAPTLLRPPHPIPRS